ncbi:MAG TPA: MauE/DoxX family redox-associated membrane protein [Streptosporangiaceae bacterium]|jgi:hypothetical protein
MGALLAGCVVSCGVVLVVAGLSKVYRGARGIDSGAAVRRVLRMPRRRWARVSIAVGSLECLVGALVCAGVYPVFAGAAMGVLGAVFCVLLGYVRIKRVPGDCGCIGWRRSAAAADAGAVVTWRTIARSGLLLGAGVVEAVAVPAGDFHHAWYDAGILAGCLVQVLLTLRRTVRTPVCHRRLWRPARAALKELAAHETFAAMAASAGPFGPRAGYRRDGCTEEFWLKPAEAPAESASPASPASPAGAAGAKAVVFQVNYPVPGAPPAVHASLQDMRTAGGVRWRSSATSWWAPAPPAV